MTIGEKIKYYRTFRKISQKTLSELSGVSEGAIRKYESGTRNPKKPQIKAIADAMGLDEFVFFDTNIDTPAVVMTLLYLLDDSFDISFEGKKDDHGNITPESLTLRFENEELNSRLVKWSIMKSAYKSISRENYTSDEEYELVLYTMQEKYEQVKLMLADSRRIITKDTKL